MRKMFPNANYHYACNNIFLQKSYQPHLHHQQLLSQLGGLLPRSKGKESSVAGSGVPINSRTSNVAKQYSSKYGVDSFHYDPLTVKRSSNLQYFRKPVVKPQMHGFSPYLNMENQQRLQQYRREAEMLQAHQQSQQEQQLQQEVFKPRKEYLNEQIQNQKEQYQQQQLRYRPNINFMQPLSPKQQMQEQEFQSNIANSAPYRDRLEQQVYMQQKELNKQYQQKEYDNSVSQQKQAYMQQNQNIHKRDSLDYQINKSVNSNGGLDKMQQLNRQRIEQNILNSKTLDPSYQKRQLSQQPQYMKEYPPAVRSSSSQNLKTINHNSFKRPIYETNQSATINPKLPGAEGRILRDIDRKGPAAVVPGNVQRQQQSLFNQRASLANHSYSPSQYRVHSPTNGPYKIPIVKNSNDQIPRQVLRVPSRMAPKIEDKTEVQYHQQVEPHMKEYYKNEFDQAMKSKEMARLQAESRKQIDRSHVEQWNKQAETLQNQIIENKKKYQQAYHDILKNQIKQRNQIKYYMQDEDVHSSIKPKSELNIRRDSGTIHPDYSGVVAPDKASPTESYARSQVYSPSPKQIYAAQNSLMHPKVAEYYQAKRNSSDLARNPITNPQDFKINSPYLLRQLEEASKRRY